MKILLFGDAHFCERSSILTKHGQRYSLRLENMLSTFNWVKEQAEKHACDMIVGLGDFFNSSQLTDTEITAAKELVFAELPTYFIVGNHESSQASLTFSSTKLLENNLCKIVDKPMSLMLDDVELCFLPYVVECDRKPLSSYFPANISKKRVILSHNDIKGISYGPIDSVCGFEISDIETNCNLYINAHIHNGQKITDKIYNIGNITGQNLSEDAFKYSHNIIILDTQTLKLDIIENPYAYNFYKIQINADNDLDIFDKLKTNAVVSIKCPQNMVEKVRQKVEKTLNIIESRIILIRQLCEETSENIELDLTVDHLNRFIECCKTNIENSILLDEELNEICK